MTLRTLDDIRPSCQDLNRLLYPYIFSSRLKNAMIDCEIFEKAFLAWLDSTIPKRSYSKAAREMFFDNEAPIKAFRRRRNQGTAWKLNDLCRLANYIDQNISDMIREAEGVYKVELQKHRKLPTSGENDKKGA